MRALLLLVIHFTCSTAPPLFCSEGLWLENVTCGGHGACDFDTGVCQCSGGFVGPQCTVTRDDALKQSAALEAFADVERSRLLDWKHQESSCSPDKPISCGLECVASWADCTLPSSSARRAECESSGEMMWCIDRCVPQHVGCAASRPIVPPCPAGRWRCPNDVTCAGSLTECAGPAQAVDCAAPCLDGMWCQAGSRKEAYVQRGSQCASVVAWDGCMPGEYSCATDASKCALSVGDCGKLINCADGLRPCGALRSKDGTPLIEFLGGRLVVKTRCLPQCDLSLAAPSSFSPTPRAMSVVAALDSDSTVMLGVAHTPLLTVTFGAGSAVALLDRTVPIEVFAGVLSTSEVNHGAFGELSASLAPGALVSRVFVLRPSTAAELLSPARLSIKLDELFIGKSCAEAFSDLIVVATHDVLDTDAEILPLQPCDPADADAVTCHCMFGSTRFGGFAVVDQSVAALSPGGRQLTCQVTEWEPWAPCPAVCGETAVQSRQRSLRGTAPTAKSAACPPLRESRRCTSAGASSRPEDDGVCSHCIVSTWGAWTSSCPCPRPLSGGDETRERARGIDTLRVGNGRACPELREEQNCTAVACGFDCAVSDWSSWAACDTGRSMCGGGTSSRSRDVVKRAEFRGRACPVLLDWRDCEAPKPCAESCKVVSAWGAFGPCSQSCGASGTRVRSRQVVGESGAGASGCPMRTQAVPCNALLCPRPCELSEWVAWSQCTAECGGGTKTRTRAITEHPVGGLPCEVTSQMATCNEQPCPVDCSVGEWGIWTGCVVECGIGDIVRTRRVVVPPANGGAECPRLSDDSKCTMARCDVECVLGVWAVWHDCSASCGGGEKKRDRTVDVPPRGEGKCPEESETRICNGWGCPLNCELSEWHDWSPCSKSCGYGLRGRQKDVLQYALYGGRECGTMGQTVGCNSFPCPIECEVTPWQAWEACWVGCGQGETYRLRRIETMPSHTERACPALRENKGCSAEACGQQCAVDFWREWSECTASCSGGQQSRSRIALSVATGDYTCPALRESRACAELPCDTV